LHKLCRDTKRSPYVLEGMSEEEAKHLLEKQFKVLQGRPGWAGVRDALRMADEVEKAREQRIGRTGFKRTQTASSIVVDDLEAAGRVFIKARPEGRVEEPARPASTGKQATQGNLAHQHNVNVNIKRDVAAGEKMVNKEEGGAHGLEWTCSTCRPSMG
jgi:hypothetical protein